MSRSCRLNIPMCVGMVSILVGFCVGRHRLRVDFYGLTPVSFDVCVGWQRVLCRIPCRQRRSVSILPPPEQRTPRPPPSCAQPYPPRSMPPAPPPQLSPSPPASDCFVCRLNVDAVSWANSVSIVCRFVGRHQYSVEFVSVLCRSCAG